MDCLARRSILFTERYLLMSKVGLAEAEDGLQSIPSPPKVRVAVDVAANAFAGGLQRRSNDSRMVWIDPAMVGSAVSKRWCCLWRISGRYSIRRNRICNSLLLRGTGAHRPGLFASAKWAISLASVLPGARRRAGLTRRRPARNSARGML